MSKKNFFRAVVTGMLFATFAGCADSQFSAIESAPSDVANVNGAPAPVCRPSDLSALAQILVQSKTASIAAIAANCADDEYPTPESSLPVDAVTRLRFQITCGNRFCLSQGFESGRVIEVADGNATLQCLHSTPPQIGNSCEGILKGVPLVQILPAVTNDVANECRDDDVPELEQNLPSASAIRFVNTCGQRYCAHRGFRDGRVIEGYGSSTTVECYSDPSELFLNLIVNAEDVANNCIDAVVTTKEGSMPDYDSQRFVGTCANRYCQQVLKQGTGRITEYRDGKATLTCLRTNF